jgi:hypothetical protein
MACANEDNHLGRFEKLQIPTAALRYRAGVDTNRNGCDQQQQRCHDERDP